jgi:hypothetical protein
MHTDPAKTSLPAPNHDPADNSPFETLTRLNRDLEAVIRGLSLLGVERCSQCRQFFQCSDPGALFDAGQLVCLACIPEWWSLLSAGIGIADRERIEGKLAGWLRKYHAAEVVREAPGKLLDATNAKFQMVVKCLECTGSGKLMEGERCRFCSGVGTLRILVPR